MTSPSGSVSVGVSLDADDLTAQLTSAVQDAVKSALSSLQSGVSGMNSELGRVDASGFNDVSTAADTAMDSAQTSVQSGMSGVAASLGDIDASGFSDVSAAADAAAEATATSMAEGAGQAGSALSSIDTTGLANVSSAADGAATSVSNIGAAAGEASSAMGDIGAQAGGASDGFQGLGDDVGGADSALSGFAGGAAAKLGKFAGPVAGVIGGFTALKGAIDSAADTQATEASLSALYGSGEEAADMMTRIDRITKESSIETGAYNNLAQSLGYLGVKGQEGEDIMRNLGKVIVASGGDSTAFDTVSSALTRMQNEGKVTRMTLTQLSNAGVPVLDALATEMGKSTDEILDLVTEGGVAVDDVLGVIENGTGEWMGKLIDGSDEVEDTLGNTWSRLKSNTMDTLGAIAMPIVEMLTPALGWLADGIGNVTNLFSGLGDESSVIGEVFGWIGEKASGLWEQIGPIFGQLWSFIVDSLVPAFQSLWTDTIQPVWTMIGGIIADVWTNTLQPMLSALIGVIRENVMPTIISLWENVMLPVFSKIGELITALWEGILGPIFRLLADILSNVVAPVVMWLWQNVMGPAFQAIGKIIQVAWTIMSPIFDVLIAVIGNIGNVMSWLWNNVVEPVWNGIGATISWVWNNLIAPAWRVMQDELGALGGFFSWIWDNIINPVWTALGDGISWVVDNIILPAWDVLGRALDTLGGWFDTTVGFIGDMWNRIKGIVATPINFVIDFVYNRGIAAMWNKVAGWLGLGELPTADLIPGYATGGVYPGYTPGKDIGYIGVSGGEAIMRPEWTRAVGSDYVDQANNAARSGGVGGVRSFTQEHGLPYLGGYFLGGALDKVKGAAGAVWENTGGKVMDAADFVGDTIKKVARTGFRKSVEFIFDQIVAPIGRGIPEFGGGEMGKVPRKGFEYISETTKEFLLSLADSRDEAEKQRKVDYDPSGGAEQWRGVVEQALEMTGHSLDNVDRVLQQINIESGGDPNALNDWDENWERGTPSKGLIQTIDPTFQGYRDPSLPNDPNDPLANIVAGINYADATYGDIANIWPKTLGYALGGPVFGAGSGTSDDILARLSNGEFVVNAKSTRENRALLEALNAGWSPPPELMHEMLPAYADGGLVTIDELVDFARGVEGKPYDWGGVNWGDCSGAVAALARYATGLDPFGGRFATSNEGDALSQMGFEPGVGPAGSLSIGWYNGGPWGGHTAATLPDGTHFEMGGARGNGQFGGAAVGADWSQFTDQMHLGPEFFTGGDPKDIPGVGDWADSVASDNASALANYTTTSPGVGANSANGGGGGGGVGASGVSGAAAATGGTATGGTGAGAVVGAIDGQTATLSGIADDQSKTWDDYHKEQLEALKDNADAWAYDNIRVPVRDALTGALGSQEADRFAMVLASGVGETVSDLVSTVEDQLVSAITSIITDLITNISEGLLDAAFGERDESKYGDPILQALMKTVGVSQDMFETMYASAESLDDLTKDRDTAYSQMGRILSDNSEIIQRNTSSRERVEAERDLAMQKLVEGTIRTAVTKILIPIATAVIGALITAAFAALGAAIGSIIPGIGTAIGAAIGGSVGAGFAGVGSGLIGDALGGMFDSGGLAHGTGLMPKGVIAPERVLSPRQTSLFERMVDSMDGRGRSTRTVNAPITVYGDRRSGAVVQSSLLELID